MKSYFRFLSRNKLYTLINVAGLVVSLMFIILMGDYTWRQFSIDSWHKDADRICIIGNEDDFFMWPQAAAEIKQMCPEIEQTLSKLSGEKVILTFVPHLLPVNRGILATCYADIKEGVSFSDIRKAYEDFYKDEYFVRLLPDGMCADIHNIKYSNFCDISLHYDSRANKLIACSAIDNMVKGAAGQAIQNMNIIFGLDEKTGLDIVPPAF